MKQEEKISVEIHHVLQQLGIDQQKFENQVMMSSSQSTPRNAQLLQKQ